eukprot:c9194_g1_i1.p1 GENE.c9194_g1_i1~~c9194_g1_i1.p1  ORF type:complete len:576 (-),score=115.41 c9194_g1_i1:20-1726(-)
MSARQRKQDKAKTQEGSFHEVVSTSEGYSPNFKVAFLLLAIPRVLSAAINIMSDCDEVFNYWEPTHFLLYGFGLQTWEYSPEFALRSYAYSALHAIIAWAVTPISANKIGVYHNTRLVLGLLCALAEAYFFRSVRRCYGAAVANVTLFFLATSAGMFLASTAYLPNSFAMECLLIGFGSWMRLSTPSTTSGSRINSILCIGSVSCAVLMGTPFVIVTAVPLAFSVIYYFGLVQTIGYGVMFSSIWIGGSVVIDNYIYGYPTCAIFNTLMYNALSGGPGSQLYGVEPWTFYAKNLFANFNGIALLAVLSFVIVPFFSLLGGVKLRLPITVWHLSPLLLWFVFMFNLEHKEERFLFPVYPLICFAGALCLCVITNVIRRVLPISFSGFVGTICVLTFVVSVSRVVAMTVNYSASVSAWRFIHEQTATARGDVTVCVSKEWYRFPSSFFLPSAQVHFRYVQSDFTGQLPQPYSAHANATQVHHRYFNDRNQGDPTLFTPISECDYFVDFEPTNQVEPKLSEQLSWRVLFNQNFLDASRSPSLYRAFYIPILSPQHVVTAPYLVLQKQKSRN